MNRKTLSPQDMERKLVEFGVQPTLQRISIAQFVLGEADHPTAEQVLDWAEKNLAKISQATVYNTLGTLVDAGLLRAFRFPHSEKVFYDCNLDEHFHFLDEKSGQLYDIDKEDINFKLELPKKFKMRNMELMIKGEVKI